MKKAVYIPLAVVILSAAFLIISLMVIFSRNKTPWIKRKLRLGALLLGLTSLSATACKTDVRMCYAQVQTDNLTMMKGNKSDYSTTINLKAGKKHTLIYKVTTRYCKAYSFCITKGKEIIHRGEMNPVDGKLDARSEILNLILPASIPAGSYKLKLFIFDKAKQKQNNYRIKHNLILK